MNQMNCINQREAKKRGVIDRVGYAQGYAQGRRDAVNEMLRNSGKHIFYMDKYCDFEGHAISNKAFLELAEKVKEQKNE